LVLLPCCPQLISCCHLSPNDHFTLLIFVIFLAHVTTTQRLLLLASCQTEQPSHHLGSKKNLPNPSTNSFHHINFFICLSSTLFSLLSFSKGYRFVLILLYFVLHILLQGFTFLLRMFPSLQERFSTQIDSRFRFLYLPLFYHIFAIFFLPVSYWYYVVRYFFFAYFFLLHIFFLHIKHVRYFCVIFSVIFFLCCC
jgi:hypothetical protein